METDKKTIPMPDHFKNQMRFAELCYLSAFEFREQVLQVRRISTLDSAGWVKECHDRAAHVEEEVGEVCGAFSLPFLLDGWIDIAYVAAGGLLSSESIYGNWPCLWHRHVFGDSKSSIANMLKEHVHFADQYAVMDKEQRRRTKRNDFNLVCILGVASHAVHSIARSVNSNVAKADEAALKMLRAVHKANMKKVRGTNSKRSKQKADAVKPKGWISPDGEITDIIAELAVDGTSREGSKEADGKAMFAAVPQHALREVSRVFTYGAMKYGRNNYKKGVPNSLHADALLRHANAWLLGEESDRESGFHHLAHATACAMMILEINHIHGTKFDDRKGQ